MATPVGDSYSAASGVTIYGGRTAGAAKPAWLAAAAPAIGQIVEIPGTAGFGGATPAFSGQTADTTTGNIYIGLSGGHTDGGDNRMVRMNPRDNAPAWTVLRASSVSQQQNVPYYDDGLPASRHTGQMTQLVPGTDHIIWGGARSLYGGPAFTSLAASAYNLLTNQYEPASYLPDIPSGTLTGGSNVDYDDELWIGIFSSKYNKANRTWGAGASGADVGPLRYPWATNKIDREVFGLCYGDGEVKGSSPGIHAGVMRNGVLSVITISPGPALTQFLADQPVYAAMGFDSVNRNYVYMDLDAGRYYTIQRNSGTTWAMTLFTPTGALPPTQPPGSSTSYGAMCRCVFDPVLGGFIFSQFINTAPTNQLFLRTV